MCSFCVKMALVIRNELLIGNVHENTKNVTDVHINGNDSLSIIKN